MLTPQIYAPNLARKIGLKSELCLKREDLHPMGSHKGRSIPLMIDKYAGLGIKNFVISSSGNAALAAVLAIRGHNSRALAPLSLTVYVGKKIEPTKLSAIIEAADSDRWLSVKRTANPKQAAFLAAKKGSVQNLRQSTDDSALLGYKELARELAEINNLAAIFVPTSSGTLVEGIYNGFQEAGINPEIHIVQTPSCHPFVPSPARRAPVPSLATAIVDRVAHRSKQIKQILIKTGGKGWVAENDEIIEAINLANQCENIVISPTSALAVAGLKKAVLHGVEFKGPVVCLITGK